MGRLVLSGVTVLCCVFLVVVLFRDHLFDTTPPNSMSRKYAEIRSVRVALESYYVDHGLYPKAMEELRYPVPYHGRPSSLNAFGFEIRYFTTPTQDSWMLTAPGPDGILSIDSLASEETLKAQTYDPTNGLSSGGDLVRKSKSGTGQEHVVAQP